MIEAILISGIVSQYVIPLVGVVITGLVGYGVSLLKRKINSDMAKTALDQIDQIVGTVVGQFAQTGAKALKLASADGHLSQVDKDKLKTAALQEAKYLISTELAKAAETSVEHLDSYMFNKIEDWVPIKKASMPVMPKIQIPPMPRLKVKKKR